MALNPPFVAANTAPTGQENTGVTRPIFRKNTVIETMAPLPSNGVFVGPWHDTQADGTVQVTVTSLASQAAAASGLVIQETEDVGNASFVRSILTFSASANVLTRNIAAIRARYWRVKYTNGATAQATFELTSCSTNFFIPWTDSGTGATPQVSGSVIGVVGTVIATAAPDNASASNFVTPISTYNTSGGAIQIAPMVYGGAFSGTASASLQGWSKPRTPTIYKQATASASGNTALWTPGTNNKFRLLKFKIQVTADATTSGGGRVTIGLQDSTTDLGLSHLVFVPTSALNTIQDYDSGWIDLGSFGILSAAAGNVLNVNLGTALSAGLVNVIACGTEE